MRIYYNYYTTGLEYIASPYHKLTETELAADIDNTLDAGIDVYLIQPGTYRVLFWKMPLTRQTRTSVGSPKLTTYRPLVSSSTC